MPAIIATPIPPTPVLSTTTAKSIIDKVSLLLHDTLNERWTRPELLGWLNDAQVAIVQAKPGSNNKVISMKLSPGVRQNLPVDGWLLLEVYRNLGTDGSTPGSSISLADRGLMDSFMPDWPAATPSAEVESYMFSLQDEPVFYVYPPSTGTNYVEVNYSFFPTALTDETQVINIRDIYVSAAIDFVCYRAMLKDAEATSSNALADKYKAAFDSVLETKDKGELENNPNLSMGARNPAVRGASK